VTGDVDGIEQLLGVSHRLAIIAIAVGRDVADEV
jgi:hypothetical protein